MINPVHRLKKFVKYVGDDKPASSYVTDHSGWLGSGVKDKNGKEIFEGDRVKGSDIFYTVRFVGGALLAFNESGEICRLLDSDLEVIGHIAEDEA